MASTIQYLAAEHIGCRTFPGAIPKPTGWKFDRGDRHGAAGTRVAGLLISCQLLLASPRESGADNVLWGRSQAHWEEPTPPWLPGIHRGGWRRHERHGVTAAG